MKKTKTKKLINQKDKGIVLGALLFSLFLYAINPTLSFFADDIGEFEFSHFPKTEERELSNIEKIKVKASKICKSKGLSAGYEDYCVMDMVAIAYVESRFDCSVIGDNGASHGCYQIHQGYHKHITQAQAEDLDFAIDWTLSRMIAHGYPKNRSYAIRKHNGSANNPKTLSYLNSVNNFLKK